MLGHSVLSDFLQRPGLYPTRLLCPWNFPGKNAGVECHFLLQGIFPTQGSNLSLLHLLRWQTDSFPLGLPGKPWCLTLCDHMDCGHPRLLCSPHAPLSMELSRQEYWSGLPCLPPGDLPNPGIEPESLMSPALAGRFFSTFQASTPK